MAEIKGSYVAGTATISPNTNIGFKLGTEANLKALAQAQNGVFYLTSDTHRLYIGNSDGSVSPVNQGVIAVDKVSGIQNAIPGQFYYETSTNILATYNGSRWLQINPDTYITEFKSEVKADGDNGAKIVHDIAQEGGYDNHMRTDATAVVIEGGQKVYVAADATNNHIEIATGDYGVKTADAAAGVDVVLTYTDKAGTVTDEEKVNFKPAAGSKIKITQAENAISFDTSDIQNSVDENNLKEAAFSNGHVKADKTTTTEGFTLTLTKNGGQAISAAIDPKITYGKAGLGAGQHTHSFDNGVNTLHVYTMDQVDQLIDDSLMKFNALTYKGTVGSVGATVSALPQSGVASGDVYMGDGSVAVKLTANGAAELYDAGTLFIATGTEGTDGTIPANSVVWTRVQNYNADTVTGVETGVDNKISFYNHVTGGANDDATIQLGSLTIVSGDDIINAEASHNGLDQTITITHEASPFVKTETVTEAATNAAVLYGGKALGAITVDNYGHIQTAVEVPITVPTEVFTESTTTSEVSVAESGDKDTATFTDTITLKNYEGGDISAITLKNQISSETLTLVKDGNNTMKMDLMWGSF